MKLTTDPGQTGWHRLGARPIARILYKYTIGKLKYGRGDTYDAERYWSDRFEKYGASLLGPGHEGLSEDENEHMYNEGRRGLICSFCDRQKHFRLPVDGYWKLDAETGILHRFDCSPRSRRRNSLAWILPIPISKFWGKRHAGVGFHKSRCDDRTPL